MISRKKNKIAQHLQILRRKKIINKAWLKLVLTLELNVTLILSIISTKISSLFFPPGSLATTDFVTAVPGIRFVPCCKR